MCLACLSILKRRTSHDATPLTEKACCHRSSHHPAAVSCLFSGSEGIGSATSELSNYKNPRTCTFGLCGFTIFSHLPLHSPHDCTMSRAHHCCLCGETRHSVMVQMWESLGRQSRRWHGRHHGTRHSLKAGRWKTLVENRETSALPGRFFSWWSPIVCVGGGKTLVPGELASHEIMDYVVMLVWSSKPTPRNICWFSLNPKMVSLRSSCLRFHLISPSLAGYNH